MAVEKKLSEEKEKRLKLEIQFREQKLLLKQKEQLVSIPTSDIAEFTCVKPTQPPKMSATTQSLVTGSLPRIPVQQQMASNRFSVSQPTPICTGMHPPLLTTTPRLSTALAYATATPIPEIQSHMLQPTACANNTQLATVAKPVVYTSTSTVPYCTTVSQLTGSTSNVANVNIVPLCDNIMSLTTVQPISENAAIPASMPATNLGVPQNAPPSISQTAPMVDTSPKFVTSCCTASTQAQPILQQQQPQVQTLVVPPQTVPTVVV